MIRRDLKNMKKRRAAICFLMVFIMSFTLLPSGVFAAQNDSLKAKQQLAEQSRKFDEDKEKQEEETKASETSAKDASKNTAKQDADTLRMPELSEEAPSDIDGTVIKRDENSTTYQTGKNSYVTRISSEPLLYTDEKGREKEIDNTLKKSWLCQQGKCLRDQAAEKRKGSHHRSGRLPDPFKAALCKPERRGRTG